MAPRVGPQLGNTWNWVNIKPSAARASMFGVAISDPKTPTSEYPRSSATISKMLGRVIAYGPLSGTGDSRLQADTTRANERLTILSERNVIALLTGKQWLIPPITDIFATGDFIFEVFLDIEWHVLHVGFDTLTNCLGFRACV
jgi:hypothetical protein